jgi:glycosyltransferase involved in cell wall biosynthesis
MKVTIILPVFNCCEHICGSIDSIIAQNHKSIELIVIDGGSTDGTLEHLKKYAREIYVLVSRADKGIYDGINTGLALASGDIIGILNADDVYSSTKVITRVVEGFMKNNCEAVYGNLMYIRKYGNFKTTRKWKSKALNRSSLRLGWMPAHPTVFIKRLTYNRYGFYSLKFGTCGDYELLLRYFLIHKIDAVYLDVMMVTMREGGMSNGSLSKRYDSFVNDYRILSHTNIHFPIAVAILKRVRKLNQFINK